VEDIRSSRSRAASLSSISFRLPHFGLCTHEGQPLCRPAREAVKTPLGDTDAAGVAVVDEDGRESRLEVDVRGKTADVPAIAHGPER
jgi:hypothetical protein